MKLVEANLSVRKARDISFHHCRGAVKLVQACLSAEKVRQSGFNHAPWSTCESRGGLFKRQEKIENEVFSTVEVL